MKQFLSSIQPKYLLGALVFLFTSTMPTHFNSPRYEFLNNTFLTPSGSAEPSLSPTSDDLTDPAISDSNLSDEAYDFPSQLIIKAVNPGYTNADKLTNVGELITLQNLAGTMISLAGLSVRYTNGSGKTVVLFTFPEGSTMTGELLLMRYSKTPDADQSDLTYSSSLAMTAGPLELVYDGEVIDSVCWTGKDDCVKPFKSTAPTTLVRNLSTGEFEHLLTYEPYFDPTTAGLYFPEPDLDPGAQELAPPQCRGLEFSEILTYYTDAPAEQFVELYNPTAKDINLDGCQLQYKNKTHVLSGTIPTGDYLAYYPSSTFSFTKNPNTNNTLSLIDTDGEVIDELIYAHGQKKATSYAKFYDVNGVANWSITYNPTPGSSNNLQTFRTCPAGKVVNPATGNCVNIATSSTADCPAGKYRNPLTGRCKNIEGTTATLKECAEGYERNPTTNRCRKNTSPNNGADYALVPTTSSSGTTFAAIGIVVIIITLGVVYIALQFRHEAARAARKIRQRGHDILKNQLARKIRRNRDKET